MQQVRDVSHPTHEQGRWHMITDGDTTTVGAGEQILPWARAVLVTTVERWTRLTQTVPADLLNRMPAPGEWSAVECLRHLLETERYGLPVRVHDLLAGREFPAYDPEAPDRAERDSVTGLTILQLVEAFADAREAGLAVLAQVREQDLDRSARHRQFGVLMLREVLHVWAAHDLNHTVQAERAVMQPFILGSGPLAFRFADHLAQEAES
jgi:hypothetical protein